MTIWLRNDDGEKRHSMVCALLPSISHLYADQMEVDVCTALQI